MLSSSCEFYMPIGMLSSYCEFYMHIGMLSQMRRRLTQAPPFNTTRTHARTPFNTALTHARPLTRLDKCGCDYTARQVLRWRQHD
jgi:hypothetical protein